MTQIFRQYDIRGRVGQELTDEIVAELGKALATFYRRRQVSTISLGCDCRLSSPRFRELLVQNLLAAGINILDLGLVPTPLLYFSLFHLPVGGGVMITGSHNPPDENGFKICLDHSTIYGEAIQELRQIITDKDYLAQTPGTLAAQPLNQVYLDQLQAKIKPGPRKIKVVLDGGNGTANPVAAPLYQRLGWEVVELYSEPDGRFPNHHPDPTLPENLTALIAQVQQSQADLGIAFDGDGDRLGVVDPRGRILWGDQLLLLLAPAVLREHPGATIIGEVKCSQTMFDGISSLGGQPLLCPVGHSLIKAKMKEAGALLAGEMSGHLFFADRYYGYDDAIYAGARFLETLSDSEQSLLELVDQLPPTFTTPEIRVPCPDQQKFQVVAELTASFSRHYPTLTIDGVRISFPEGWGLVRASNTQPLLVMRFEATSSEALARIQALVTEELQRIGP